MHKFTPFALLALGLAGSAVAQEPLTLQQTIDRVVAHYPTLDAAQAEIEAARARTTQVASARLPQVGAGASYTYVAPRPYVDFSLPGFSSSFYETSSNVYQAGLTARQLLTDFGQTDAMIKLARNGEVSAADALDAARTQLAYAAIQSFYGVILLRESVSVSDDEIKALDEALRISNRKLTGGTATKFDVLTTQVRLATAQNVKTDTQAALEKQEAQLRQLLGLAPDTPLALAGGFPSPGELPQLTAAIAAGLENRPEMKTARDSAHSADLQLDIAAKANRPVLAAQAAGGVQDGQLPNLYDNRGYIDAGVSVSVPLFTGRRITGQKAEARAGQRAAAARIADLDRTIATEVSDAFADLRAAVARLKTADLLVDQSQEALALARSRYTNGVITNFELLDAQSAARNSALARLQARYDWTLARQSLARASGEPAKP
jgi:outer membrane protein TolC